MDQTLYKWEIKLEFLNKTNEKELSITTCFNGTYPQAYQKGNELAAAEVKPVRRILLIRKGEV